MEPKNIEPLFFKIPGELRKWFVKNHSSQTELLVGFYKIGSGKQSITWSESVDQAICFGWIDGVRKSIDEHRYMIRFTPRKPKSIWSAVNIKKVEALSKLGQMEPPGVLAFEKRKEANSKIYSFEQEHVALSKEFLKIFKGNKAAWKYFQSQAPSYQKAASWWIISPKQEQTRLKRLNELMERSASGLRAKHLIWSSKSK